MNGASYMILAIVFLLVLLAFRTLKKNGNSCSSCSGCSASGCDGKTCRFTEDIRKAQKEIRQSHTA